MPDGKPDRHIIPANSFRSGLRAGRAAERARATALFSDFLVQEGLSDPQRAARMAERFAAMLRGDGDKAGG